MALHPAEKYAKDVLSGGKVKTGRLMKLTAQRYFNDLKTASKKGLVFNREAAEASIEFASMCYHWKGPAAGQPIQLLPYQQFKHWNLYGWYNKDGSRRFRKSYEEIARKNGKTTGAGIRADYRILIDEPHGAQVFCGATKEDQARIVVNDAGQILVKAPFLKDMIECRYTKGHEVSRVLTRDLSYIRAIGRDSRTEDGRHPSMIIIDEYHAHNDDYILNILESGMKGRANPLIDIITTAGFNKDGPCFNLRKVCVEILEGHKVDESLFIMIHSLDDTDDWEDEKNWIKANPSLGQPGCVTIEDLRARYVSAKNEGSTKEVDFKTKDLNIWTDAPMVWIKDKDWMANKAEPVNLYDKRWFGGLDLSSTTDFTAYVLLSEPDEHGIHDVLPYFWIPEDTLDKRAREDGVQFRNWKDQGYLNTTPGNAIEPAYIKNFILSKHQELNIIASAFDQALRGNELAGQLNNEGCEFNPISQGITTLSPYTKELNRLVLLKKLRHAGHPVLRWMCRNSVVKIDSNENIKITKADRKQRVDGMVALVMAIARYQAWQKAETETTDWGLTYVTI